MASPDGTFPRIGARGAARYETLAREMRAKYEDEEGLDGFSSAFLAPANVAPVLYYVEQSVQAHRFNTPPEISWDVVYAWLKEFAGMDKRSPGAAWRQFENLRGANLAFKNAMVDPGLVADQYLWHWQFELAEKKMNGIDASQLRRYARDPTVVDDRGRPALLGRANRGVGALQLRTGPYFLAHPDANGRAKQRAALALSNFEPDPDVRCAFSFRPRPACTQDRL